MRSPTKLLFLTSCLIVSGSRTALAGPLVVTYQSNGTLAYNNFAGISIEKNFIFDDANFDTNNFFSKNNLNLVNLFKKLA